MPSHLIANILEQGTEDEIVFEDREEGEFFISQVMALWNEILKFQGEKSAPVFSPIPEEYEELDQLLYALSERANELQSFLFGLAEGGFSPDGLEPVGELALFVGTLVAGVGMLEDEIKKVEGDPSDENCERADALLRVIDKRGDKGFPMLENELRRMRAEAFKALKGEGAPLEVPLKIGRNEPCSCGSGKKYKKCCLH